MGARTVPHDQDIAIMASAIKACNDQPTRVIQAPPGHAGARYHATQTAKTPVCAP
jgi:hypothetical protein